jgi:hypothetical protein
MSQFAGFTNDQMFKLAQMKGYTGNNNIDAVNNFIMGNDKAKSYVMDMFNQATTLVGRQKRGFAPGGMPLSEMNKYISGTTGDYKDLSTFDSYNFSNAPFTLEEWKAQARAEGYGANTQKSADQNKAAGSTVPGATTYTPDATTTGGTDPSTTDPNADPNADPSTKPLPKANYSGLGTKTPVNVIDAKTPGTIISSDAGQISGDPSKPSIGDIAATDTVKTNQDISAEQMTDITKTKTDVNKIADDLSAAKGTIDDEDKVDAQTMTEDELSQLDPKYDAAQIDDAQTVTAPNKRTLQDNETVQSAYDKDKADEVIKETEKAFVTADPSTKALVQGQLDNLMDDFKDGATPIWASGAMRTALAALNARGLNASSLAGQAVVQAAMESAIPIAQADAGTVAKFEMQNLNNRQQATVLAAEQRANFLKVEFDQEFQARVKNASTISEIARQNYDADVQIALENARMANTVDLANLDAKNAKILSDAAALTKMDLTNLTNKQQAEVANANNLLQMDLKNLDNEQQTTIFKAEAKMQALFKDQTADNAAKQFNAEQKNQVDMFIEGLVAQMQRFNSEQKNAMETVQFQEDAANEKFFASLKEQRAQFNATNSLVVSQANAKWYQDVTTANNAAVNQANMNDANNATALTKMQLEQEFQADRDLMNWAFTADDNDKQRAASIMIAKMDADAQQAEARGGLFQSLITGFVSAMNPLDPT